MSGARLSDAGLSGARSSFALALLTLALGGCRGAADSSARVQQPLVVDVRGSAPSNAEALNTTTPSATPAPIAAAYDDERVLDVRADGARLLGRALNEPIPNTGVELALSLRTERDGQPLDPALEGARVLMAAFAGDAIVILGVDHVLRAHVGGRTLELDPSAQGPLSTTAHAVAYVRGEMPDYELAVAELTTGTARAWTTGMAPVWCPALSPDGREAVFVSGVSGVSRLYAITVGGAPRLLVDEGVFPGSTNAPRFDGTTLSFEDERRQPHTLRVREARP